MSADPQHLELPEPVDELPAQILECALDQWIDNFPVDKVQAALADLERQKGSIEAAIRSLNSRLQVWTAMRAHQAGIDNHHGRPTKRDSVLNLLERDPYREFGASEIKEILIFNGLIDDTPKARHNLDVTLSNMVKRGEAVRPRKGFYRLSPAQGGPGSAPDLHRSEGGERGKGGGPTSYVGPLPRMERESVR